MKLRSPMLTKKVEMHHFEKACNKMVTFSQVWSAEFCTFFLLTNEAKTAFCFSIDFPVSDD